MANMLRMVMQELGVEHSGDIEEDRLSLIARISKGDISQQ